MHMQAALVALTTSRRSLRALKILRVDFQEGKKKGQTKITQSSQPFPFLSQAYRLTPAGGCPSYLH